MSSPPKDLFPPPEPGLDAVVRATLDAAANRTDPRPVWNRTLTRLEADQPHHTPASRASRWWRRLPAAGLAVAGLAAAVLVVVFLIPPAKQAVASPAEVVQAARVAHEHGSDRRYTQTVTLTHAEADPLAHPVEGGRRAVVWVRGNRFVAQPGWGGTGAWGRDPDGRVWFAPTREAAVRYTEAELPATVREAVQIRGLELDALLGGVLADFDLTWADPPTPKAARRVVVATHRSPATSFQVVSAEVVIETESHLIRSLTLRRTLPAGAVATIAFELDTMPINTPVVYTAEGYLNPGSPVYDAATPIQRRFVLRKHFARLMKGGL